MASPIERYLGRLGVPRPAVADAEALVRLHEAHLLAVPFENLSIAWGEPIALDVASLHRKIVDGGRGGGCHELNGLFAWGLRELGYEVDLLSARVRRDDGGFGPAFDHMCLRVRTGGGAWLADVGFGESFRRPLALEVAAVRMEGRFAYALRNARGELELERREEDGPWTPLYRIDLSPRRLEEFAPMCAFHESSPQAPFTKGRVCTRATEWGRVTLTDRSFVRTSLGGERREEPIPDEAAFAAVLREHFGIGRRAASGPR